MHDSREPNSPTFRVSFLSKSSTREVGILRKEFPKIKNKMEIIHISKNDQVRILKPRRNIENNTNSVQVNSVKKCLFGVPEEEDVENLLQQQIKEDWERIKNRFGINVEDIENLENTRLTSTHTPKKRKRMIQNRIKTDRTKRKLFKPYDRHITGN